MRLILLLKISFMLLIMKEACMKTIDTHPNSYINISNIEEKIGKLRPRVMIGQVPVSQFC